MTATGVESNGSRRAPREVIDAPAVRDKAVPCNPAHRGGTIVGKRNAPKGNPSTAKVSARILHGGCANARSMSWLGRSFVAAMRCTAHTRGKLEGGGRRWQTNPARCGVSGVRVAEVEEVGDDTLRRDGHAAH